MTRRGSIRPRGRPVVWATVAAIVATAWAAGGAAAATLTADYRFQGTRASSVAGAADLGDAGPGANAFAQESVLGQSQQVLTFPMDNGLSLTPAGATVGTAGTYSIVMLVRLDLVDGYRRLVDFANATADSGLYVLNGTLALFPDASGTTDAQLVTAGQYAQVAMTRDAAGTVVGYINRTQVLGPYDDSTTHDALLTADDVLRFFVDDASVPGEDSSGAVARIRLYDGVLSADEVAALAPPSTPPPPVLGRSETAEVVSGTVLISVGGGKFVPLTGARPIPVGATLDTLHGTVGLTTAVDAKGHTQSGRFGGGVFRIAQSRQARDHGLTTLGLTGANHGSCGRRTVASSAAARTLRQLNGRAHGHFRTAGRYSAATVRGTVWTVADRCDGTLTSVTRGVVSVRDFARHRTVSVRAGHQYLARP